MIYAEDVNYWKSSQTAPDTWIDKAKDEIRKVRGTITGEGFLSDGSKSGYMLAFKFGDEAFQAVWDVLPSKTGNVRAARIQAATMLYHDVKNRCVLVKVKGIRFAFMPYLLLPDGRTAASVPAQDLFRALYTPSVPLIGEVVRE